MIMCEELPGYIHYRAIVPLDPNFSTHNEDYLRKVNSPGGMEVLLSAISPNNRHWLTENILLSRNKAPHGLGGLLLWHFGGKNFLELNQPQQIIFFNYLKKIELELRKIYGDAYHILLGMCLSRNPEVGKRQSIAFTHAHFSLIPKKKPPLEDYGVKFETLEDEKKVIGDTANMSPLLIAQLRQFGRIQRYHHNSTILIVSEKRDGEIQTPQNVLDNLGNEDKRAILGAKNQDGYKVGSTISLMLTRKMKTRIGISLGTQGYLHFDGIELSREIVTEQKWKVFNTFGKECFELLKNRF